MQRTETLSQVSKLACAILLLLAGCATPIKPVDVGRVVVAPTTQLPPPPAIVQTMEPLPVGYFRQSLLDYFSTKPTKPMP